MELRIIPTTSGKPEGLLDLTPEDLIGLRLSEYALPDQYIDQD